MAIATKVTLNAPFCLLPESIHALTDMKNCSNSMTNNNGNVSVPFTDAYFIDRYLPNFG